MHNNEINNKPNNLFVYGTLAPGRPNEHILSKIGGAWVNASIKGILKQKGWGAEMGYPGIVLGNNEGKVKGLIFISENLSDHWEQLDAFEGDGYERVTTQATIEYGSNIGVYVYALKST